MTSKFNSGIKKIDESSTYTLLTAGTSIADMVCAKAKANRRWRKQTREDKYKKTKEIPYKSLTLFCYHTAT
jgi:hypothetical protein